MSTGAERLRSPKSGFLRALIEEARRRTRLRRVGYGVAVVAALVAGVVLYLEVGAGGSRTTQSKAVPTGLLSRPTRLTIVSNNPKAARAIFHLRCAPTGGDIPSPAQACAALRSVTRKLPLGYGCPKPPATIPQGSWGTGNTTLTISGELNGKSFHNVIRDPCLTGPAPPTLMGQILGIVNHNPSYRPFKRHVVVRYFFRLRLGPDGHEREVRVARIVRPSRSSNH
jgi:hypothetical protein